MSQPGGKRIIVIGAAGSFGRVVVPHLAAAGWEVHAVDRREVAGAPAGVTVHRADILKRSFDEVLRQVRPWGVIHLAMVHRFKLRFRERHRINFEGTARVIDAALAAGVGKIVFLSRATVYGALSDQPQFLSEDHPPAAGRMFSEMADLVAADLYATTAMWRHQDRNMVVLRPVNVLGPRVSTLLQRYLARPRVFTVAGFDPVYQVVHEEDLARAVELALEPGLRGVFNVTGPGEVPLHVLIDETGGLRVPLPEPMIKLLRGRLGFPAIPEGAIQFLKYSCTVDGSRFRQSTGFAPLHDLPATLAAVRAG